MESFRDSVSTARTARRGPTAAPRSPSLRRSRWRPQVAQQPGQRHVRRLRAHLPAQPFIRFELVAVRLDALLRRVVRDATLCGGFEHTGELPGVQRAVRDQTDAKAAQRRDQLISTARTARLYRLCSEVRPMKCPAEAAHWARGHIPAGEVAAAHVADLALGDELLHRLPDLLHGVARSTWCIWHGPGTMPAWVSAQRGSCETGQRGKQAVLEASRRRPGAERGAAGGTSSRRCCARRVRH